MQNSRLTRALRFVLICLTLAVGAPLPASAPPWFAPVAGIVAIAPPAAAQTSGGYRRPGSGGYSGGFGGFDRRPSVGGGYGRPSASSSGGFGSAFGGGD